MTDYKFLGWISVQKDLKHDTNLPFVFESDLSNLEITSPLKPDNYPP